VTFDVDANGILNVKAVDKATNKEQSIRIEASTGLSDEEIERMKKDAEAHAEEDKKKKEAVEIKNTAETLVFTTEKALKEAGDKVTADEKKPVEEKIEALKKVKDGDDTDAIKKASEELSHAAQAIGEKLYKAAQENQQGSGGTGQSTTDGAGEEKKDDGSDVKDAEVEKDDDGNEKK
jgi:molecular chaperone DnaK